MHDRHYALWRGHTCDRDGMRLPLHRGAHEAHHLRESHIALKAVAAATLHTHGAACATSLSGASHHWANHIFMEQAMGGQMLSITKRQYIATVSRSCVVTQLVLWVLTDGSGADHL